MLKLKLVKISGDMNILADLVRDVFLRSVLKGNISFATLNLYFITQHSLLGTDEIYKHV